MQLPSDIHGLGNAIEAVVWWILGICMLLAAYYKPQFRQQSLTVAAGLIAFGCSDIVEISTGAWWRPWWLLVWKAACVILLCWQWYVYRRDRQLSTPASAHLDQSLAPSDDPEAH